MFKKISIVCIAALLKSCPHSSKTAVPLANPSYADVVSCILLTQEKMVNIFTPIEKSREGTQIEEFHETIAALEVKISGDNKNITKKTDQHR